MEEERTITSPHTQQSFRELVKTQPEESVASAGAQESEGKAETSQQHVAHPDHSCDDPDYSLDDPDHSCDDPDHIYSARWFDKEELIMIQGEAT